MKITVLTTLYNEEPFLDEAIESILGQTFGDFEFILVDDGSRDNSPQILRDYAKKDKRIRVLTLPDNRGTPYASNIGLKAARAPLIARMDADDISLPERLAKQYDYLQTRPATGVLGSQVAFFVKDEKTRRNKVISKLAMPVPDRRLRMRYACGLIPICHGASLYRRDLARRVGGYREFFRTGGEDHDFFQRLWDKSPVANLEETLYWYRGYSSTSLFCLKGNRPRVTAGVLMAMLCALYRQAGRGDPIEAAREAARNLEDLPQTLNLPRSVTLKDLQNSPYWTMDLIAEHVKNTSMNLRVKARLSNFLANIYRNKRQFPEGKAYWDRYFLNLSASMTQTCKALWTRNSPS